MITAALLQNRGMKSRNVHRVGLYLCFQAKAVPFAVYMSVLSFLVLYKIPGIKLYAGAVGENLHHNSRFF